jgi:hypothetical protein
VESTHAISPFVGYVATGRGALQLGPKSGPFAGARYGIRFSGPLTAEGDVSFLSSTRTVLDTIPGDTTLRAVGEADVQLLSTQVGLRFNITGPRTYHGLQPYVAAGAGMVLDMANQSPDEEDLASDVRLDFGARVAAHVGGGIEAFLSPGLSIRVDARTLLWKVTTPQPFLFGVTALTRPPDEWVQNFFLSGGIAIHF